jgi:hypothetical protein
MKLALAEIITFPARGGFAALSSIKIYRPETATRKPI